MAKRETGKPKNADQQREGERREEAGASQSRQLTRRIVSAPGQPGDLGYDRAPAIPGVTGGSGLHQLQASSVQRLHTHQVCEAASWKTYQPPPEQSCRVPHRPRRAASTGGPSFSV